MKKKDSWRSQFRKDRFYKNREFLKEKSSLEELITPFNTKKSIAIMLDLDGTCDGIDDTKAEIFLTQLELLRKKFQADVCTISISTHYQDSTLMIPVLNILSKNLTSKIKIGKNFYYGGTYNYEEKQEKQLGGNYNSNKIKTFCEYYMDDYDFTEQNVWTAFFDDSFYNDTYKQFKDTHPVLIGRPSKSKCNLKENNFMSIATTTRGFDGVIEILDTYIARTAKLTSKDILKRQQNMMTHISSFELTEKIRERNYQFLERYFSKGLADEDDYKNTLTWLTITTIKETPTSNELVHLNNIFNLISEKYQNDDTNDNVKKIKMLKETYQDK